MTYLEKLQDPKWQRKRLQILERDNYTCQICGESKITLHIHHKKYNDPIWDVLDSDLTTHCKYCHIVVEYLKKYHLDAELVALIPAPSKQKDLNPTTLICILKSNEATYAVFHFFYSEKTGVMEYCSITIPSLYRELVNKMDTIKKLENGK